MEVTYIDHMGSDVRVADAARVSFQKEVPEGILRGQDERLIKYLARHNHWTPFSHVQITMREKVPIFVARQRFKHMIGFTYNEVSRRYVDDPPEFFIPEAWRKRAEDKKQGSSDETVEYLCGDGDIQIAPLPNGFSGSGRVSECYKRLLKYSEDLYNCMIESGIAPEQARMVLPQSMYTEYYVTGSLAAWARAYNLRIDAHAQREIQDLAIMWDKVISGIEGSEHSWKALINEGEAS